MPSKVYAYATDASIGINDNAQEPGGEQHVTKPAQINI